MGKRPEDPDKLSIRLDPKWPAIRARAIRSFGSEPICNRCGEVIYGPVDVDHEVPLVLGGTHEDGLRPAHVHCNRSHGAKLKMAMVRHGRSGAVRLAKEAVESLRGITEPTRGLGGPKSPVWDVPWLSELRRVPEEGTWPRLMSAPHPRAVDSLGRYFVSYSETRSGRSLRWWQKLVATRLLEIDDRGDLCWEQIIVSVARQCGKSWLLRELCLWRLLQASYFGEEQLILHTARDLNICREVQRPARVWGHENEERFKVREANADMSIEDRESGSRWIIKAIKGVYGFSASLACVDEAWGVPGATVVDGLEPTMLERIQPQLVLVSTAHRQATDLVVERRLTQLENLGEPTVNLLVEWSAPEDSDLEDEEAWRSASPYWSEKRRDFIADKCHRARSGESVSSEEADPIEGFRTQYLNIWPTRRLQGARVHGPLVTPGTWAALEDMTANPVPERGLWVAIEDNYGTGAAVAAVMETEDERLAVWGTTFESRAEAAQWIIAVADGVESAVLLIGATLAKDPVWDGIDIARRNHGREETGPALALLRELVSNRRVVHDGGFEMVTQIETLKVTQSPGGTLIPINRTRFDLAKAAAWALAAAATSPGPGLILTEATS